MLGSGSLMEIWFWRLGWILWLWLEHRLIPARVRSGFEEKGRPLSGRQPLRTLGWVY